MCYTAVGLEVNSEWFCHRLAVSGAIGKGENFVGNSNDFKLFQVTVAKLEVTDGLQVQVQVMQSLERAGDTERRKMTKTPKAQPLTCSSHDNLWSPKRSAESLTRTASI